MKDISSKVKDIGSKVKDIPQKVKDISGNKGDILLINNALHKLVKDVKDIIANFIYIGRPNPSPYRYPVLTSRVFFLLYAFLQTIIIMEMLY